MNEALWDPGDLSFQSLSLICLVVLFCSITYLPVNAQSLEQARQLEGAGEYGAAFLEYRRTFRDRPTLAPAVLGMLRNGIRVERWGEARRALDNYEQLEPGSDTAALLGTRLYYQQDAYDTALEWAERARERAPGSWLPYYLVAETQFKRRNYVETREVLESAQLRTSHNQWVLLLKLLSDYRLEGTYDESTLERLRQVADHPRVFWELADFEAIEWSRSEAVSLLTTTVDSYPVKPPPLRPDITEMEYRLQLAKLHRRLNDPNRARETVAPLDSANNHVDWLRAVLTEDPADRLRAQSRVLESIPDQLIYRWTHSILARDRESIGGIQRSETGDFFYEEYENNRLFGYTESTLNALMRSLEMDPTVADRQFDLASYFHDRGWLESELDVLGRVRELGLDEQSRIIDYREGLNVDTDPERPTISQTRLLVDVSLNTLWQGPIKGRDVVEHMLLHSLYHQPAFEGEAVDRSPGSDTPLSLLMRERDVDGAIEVDIERWDDAFEATIVLHLPANRVEESTFYARGRMKPWRLNHELVSLLKSRWPWKGSIYREEPGGAWVNLGRVHGLETGDDFDLGDRALEAGEVLENRLRLDYPTPALQGKIDRGTTVQLQNPGNNEE